MLNAILECHVARPHAFSHEISAFINILMMCVGNIHVSEVSH